MLAHASLPLSCWLFAFRVAVHIINRLPTTVLNMQSPYELLYHKTPNYSLFRSFGCLCFPCLRPYNANKLQYMSKSCLFLGYSTQHKGYIGLEPITHRLYITRHVIFDESTFPILSITCSI